MLLLETMKNPPLMRLSGLLALDCCWTRPVGGQDGRFARQIDLLKQLEGSRGRIHEDTTRPNHDRLRARAPPVQTALPRPAASAWRWRPLPSAADDPMAVAATVPDENLGGCPPTPLGPAPSFRSPLLEGLPLCGHVVSAAREVASYCGHRLRARAAWRRRNRPLVRSRPPSGTGSASSSCRPGGPFEI